MLFLQVKKLRGILKPVQVLKASSVKTWICMCPGPFHKNVIQKLSDVFCTHRAQRTIQECQMKNMITEFILKTGKEVKSQENLSYVDYQLFLTFSLRVFSSLFIRIGRLKVFIQN